MLALLDAGLPAAAVISNESGAPGLALAAARGVPTAVVAHRDFATRESFDAALAAEIDRHAPRLVALAGFMRILTRGFVERFSGRLINIHPSLLPAFPGTDTHARALAAGVKIHGCTAHLVTVEVDCGPIVLQAALPVRPDDTAESLATRVLKMEHQIFPRAARLILDGKLAVANGVVSVQDDVGQLLFSDRA